MYTNKDLEVDIAMQLRMNTFGLIQKCLTENNPIGIVIFHVYRPEGTI
jgi:hypothetical protein